MEQLKKCPFCDGEAEIIRPIYTKPGTPVEVLLNCKTCYMGLSEPMDEAAAIAAWNRRAQSKGVQDNSMKVFEPSVQWVSNNTAAQSKEDDL